ncbi:ATP-binding cassette domain-containing protein (plasmid) [Klebsiella sp. B345]|uniref:ATP-binding cassette domain-containing protein n=1 Tax=Klebsiella sp. B345 TaxID=2755398 RepID=UPI003DA84D43
MQSKKILEKNSLLIGSTSLLTLLFFSATFLLTLFRTINNEVTIGHFVMISSYIFLLSSPLDNIGAMLSQVKQSISTLSPFFSNKTNKESSELTGFSHHLEGVEIEIKNLSFHYGDFKLINDMNLSISSGDFVTIKGRSGSGKTTLANIVSRKLPSKDGTVFLNNVDINSISERELSDVIYFVTQDECIFMDTVEFNLRIAKPTASKEELLDAIRLASLSNDFLAINNDVLSLKLGDNGETLSGGQKQRLSLARLFLRDPKLIILDEITSSLDSFNEDNVMRNIREKFPAATILNVSHKDILNNNSDLIITISDGEIIAFDCKSLTTV